MAIMEQLTERQKEVLQHVIAGQTQQSAAHTMNLSPHTVRNYLSNARKATGCQSTIELAVKFYVEAIGVSNG